MANLPLPWGKLSQKLQKYNKKKSLLFLPWIFTERTTLKEVPLLCKSCCNFQQPNLNWEALSISYSEENCRPSPEAQNLVSFGSMEDDAMSTNASDRGAWSEAALDENASPMTPVDEEQPQNSQRISGWMPVGSPLRDRRHFSQSCMRSQPRHCAPLIQPKPMPFWTHLPWSTGQMNAGMPDCIPSKSPSWPTVAWMEIQSVPGL